MMPEAAGDPRADGSGRTPAAVVALLVVLVATHTLSGLASVVHTDFARDASVALSIARGERFPLTGPLLGSAVHVGPAWFYLLALPLAVAPSYVALGLVIGFLAALKFPLAYVVGTRIGDRSLGLLFACALALPGWGSLELPLPSHPSVVGTTSLAIAWSLLALRDRRDPPRAALAGLALTAGLHAHPAMAPVVALGAIAAFWLCARSGRAVALVAALAAAALAPFAPYLYEQATTGAPDFFGVGQYFRQNPVGDPLGNYVALWYGVAVTGPRYVAARLLDLGPAAAFVVEAIPVAAALAAVPGLARLLRTRDGRTRIAITLFVLAFVSAGIVMMRPTTPYYMVFPLLPPLAFLIALGIRHALPDRRAIALAYAASLVLTAQFVAAEWRASRVVVSGRWNPQLSNIFEVKNAAIGQDGFLLLMPVARMRASGRYLCRHDDLVVHGSYAFHLKFNYALERRLECGGVDRLTAGGTDAGREHVLGIAGDLVPPALRERIADHVGEVALIGGVVPLHPPDGYPMATPDVYPPFTPALGPPRTERVEAALGPRDVVVVTNLFPYTMSRPRIAVAVDGATADEIARDDSTAVYACRGCATGARARWTIDITASDPKRVEVVAVPVGGP